MSLWLSAENTRMITNKKDTKWHILYRKNSGEEILPEMSSFRGYLSIPKELMPHQIT